MVWYFKAFALTGRQVCDRKNPGRCPGLGASALSGRVGQNLRNPEIRKSARRSGDTQVVQSATPDGFVSYSRWFSQLLQMVLSATPDGSVSYSRWFSQLLQMVLSATPDSSVSESRRLDKSTDTTPLAYVVESLTRCSRILNLVQPSA